MGVAQASNQELEEDEEELSYIKLVNHINLNHPSTEEGERFSICEYIGSFPFFFCCFKTKTNTRLAVEEIDIPRVAQQLGLGPTLFLMTTKSLAWLFFLLTLLNTPILIFYAQGNMNFNFNNFNDVKNPL